MHIRVFKLKFSHFDQSEGGGANTIRKKVFVFQSMGNWKKEYDRKIDDMTSVEEDKCHQFSHSKKMHSVKLKSAKLKEDVCKSS